MSGARPDGSYGPEYGPLPPENVYALPSRGRVPWSMNHGDYPGRLLEQRLGQPFGLRRPPFQPYAPFRLLCFSGDGGGGRIMNERVRRENTGLPDDEFRMAMEQLNKQTFRPSNPQKCGACKRGGRGILYTRSARTESPPTAHTEEENACTICLETFLSGEQVVVTPCNHMFHQGCITPWVKGHGNCPVCRFALCKRQNAITDDISIDSEDREVDLELQVMIRAMEAFSRVGHTL